MPRTASDQSRALSVMPALAADGNATRTPDTTKKNPANSQPRARRVITPHLPPTTRIEELTRIRRGRNIGLDGGSRRGPRASGTLDTAGAASPGASVHAR